MNLEFHHINFVSKDIDKMNDFYKNILCMDSIPIENFPRTEETADSGYSGKINFVTEGKIEMHLAERDLNVAFKNNQTINPVDHGHIAFRTNDIKSFLKKLRDLILLIDLVYKISLKGSPSSNSKLFLITVSLVTLLPNIFILST